MKKILALLLALSMLLALTACGGDSIATPTGESGDPHLSATGGSVPTSTPTTGTTEPPVTEPSVTEPSTTEPPVTDGEVIEPPVTEPPATEPSTTPPATEAPTQPTTPTVPSTQPTQPTTPTTPTTPPVTTEPTLPPWIEDALKPPVQPEEPEVKKYLGWEIVSIQRSENTYYCADGQDLASRVYGKDKGFQYGDVITIRVNAEGGTAVCGVDFVVCDAANCEYEVNENIVTIYVGRGNIYTSWKEVRISIFARDTMTNHSVRFNIVHSENPLTKGYALLMDYIELNGLIHSHNPNDVGDGYTAWTDDSGSFTGYVGVGCDDYIYHTDDGSWLETALWLIDKYVDSGFQRVCMRTDGSGYSFTAQ